MVDEVTGGEREQKEDTTERALSPAVNAGNRAYLLLVVAVLLLGCTDGAIRAVTGQRTILGEEVEPAHFDEMYTRDDRLQQTTLLRQYQKGPGEECKHHYNCMSIDLLHEATGTGMWQPADPFPVCRHKALFFPLTTEDMVMFAITFFTIALAAPTGTGGGGILVPMFMIIGQFSPHAAVPLSKATILGGAIANNFINVQRRHPFANRPLIDHATLHIMVPNLLIGTIFGVFVNAVSPAWLITFGLVLSLGYSTYSAGTKAWKLYLEETKADEEDMRAGDPLLGGKQMQAKHYSFDDPQGMNPQLAEIVLQESKHDFKALGLVTVVWVLVAICSWIKGGSGSSSLVSCGSWGFYSVAFTPVPVVLFITWSAGKALNDLHEKKKACGYRYADGDVVWNSFNTRYYPLIAVSLGVLAGSLGLAAGTLLGPVLLQLNLHPMVSVATTGFMVLFTASSTSLQYLLLGRLKLDYALVYTSVGLLGGACGNTVVNYVVKKYRRTWFVVFVLFVTIGFSAILLGYTGIYRTLRQWFEGEDMGFVPICQDRAHMLVPSGPLSEPLAGNIEGTLGHGIGGMRAGRA